MSAVRIVGDEKIITTKHKTHYSIGDDVAPFWTIRTRFKIKKRKKLKSENTHLVSHSTSLCSCRWKLWPHHIFLRLGGWSWFGKMGKRQIIDIGLLQGLYQCNTYLNESYLPAGYGSSSGTLSSLTKPVRHFPSNHSSHGSFPLLMEIETSLDPRNKWTIVSSTSQRVLMSVK